MKLIKYLGIISFFVTTIGFSQTKKMTLEDIWGGAFRISNLEALHSMKNGHEYSVLNYDRNTGHSRIDIYDYKTLKKVKTIVNSSLLQAIESFSNYTFSQDESQILLATSVSPIFRHSTLGIYYVYDVKTDQLTLVSEEKIQEPTFSPNGKQVAYGFENNLYIKNLESGETKQITVDGQTNQIKNGITDWVYEEEFGIVRVFEWNSSSDQIAFIKFDETNVPEFSMDVYGSELYQTQQVFKYPKAGEANSNVSLHVYHINEDKTEFINVEKSYNDFYIPRIKWTNKNDVLSAQYLNRHQNELDLWLINTKKNTSVLVLAEQDKAYVDITDNLTFLKDNSFIWTSEKKGYNHIYHYHESGKLKNQITKGDWEVTRYYGFDEKLNKIYYQSVENGSINRDLYSIDLNGKNKKRLTKKTGTNDADFSADFSYFINKFTSAVTPPEYTLNNSQTGHVILLIKDNKIANERLSKYSISKKEFSTLKINGNDLNMWMLKPVHFDSTKKYPLLMFQYSGPGSQQVANKWNNSNDYWHQYLAQQGYIIVCIDSRGTGFKGAEFKKITQKQLGKYEVEDQIEAAKILGKRDYIDDSRIGIWGWSYGGFMSSNALFKGNGVFKMAIAVAPVTSWRFYDTIYTERYMTTPQENPSGFDDNSPINHVDKLKGEFLLIHGSGDDNVHLQNTMRMVEALIQADKQFEWMIYPDKNHGIYGGNTRLHLYKKMTNFINKTLGDKLVKAKI